MYTKIPLLLCLVLPVVLLSGCAQYDQYPPLMRCDPMPDPSEAVCGTDGVNYPNACSAEEAGVQVAYEGICGMQGSVSYLDNSTPCIHGYLPNGLNYVVKGNATYYRHCKDDGSAIISYYCLNSRMAAIEMRCGEFCDENVTMCVTQ